MFLIFFFPILGAALGWLAHRLYMIMLRNHVRQQYKDIPVAEWDRYVAPVAGTLLGKLPFLGTLLGFVLGLCFIVAIFLYHYVFLSS